MHRISVSLIFALLMGAVCNYVTLASDLDYRNALGWSASGLSSSCPNNCSGQGQCIQTPSRKGQCNCFCGYLGSNCAVSSCSNVAMTIFSEGAIEQRYSGRTLNETDGSKDWYNHWNLTIIISKRGKCRNHCVGLFYFKNVHSGPFLQAKKECETDYDGKLMSSQDLAKYIKSIHFSSKPPPQPHTFWVGDTGDTNEPLVWSWYDPKAPLKLSTMDSIHSYVCAKEVDH